ncbi:chemosensory receptor B [Elysia marginata]|uniref:Chemosensory receptor B n=1 Tax=Elysia marginata TaxID=1093978 RepID=A0AAV4JA38_9GAST|nr:chemosensory receptor B [Elysia marginata]
MFGHNGSESFNGETLQLPEHIILVCVVCANFTKKAESSSISLPLCREDSFAGFQDYALGEEEKDDGFVSDSLRRLFETLNFSVLSGTISVFGCVANVINIVVFYRQKFSDSVNISLMGLAISDLGALVTLVWMSICFSPLFRSLPLPFNPVEVQYLTAGWPHVCFARITSYITAYVTLERCLCVTVPLKVKTIITPRRTTLTVISIFLILFASLAPVYFGIRLGPVDATTVTFLPNSTKANLSTIIWHFMDKNSPVITTPTSTFTKSNNNSNSSNDNSNNNVSSDASSLNGTVLLEETVCTLRYISSFVAVIICTVILVRKLAQTSRWRARTTMSNEPTAEPGGAANSTTMTQRDKRLVKMVTFLSAIFIVCFLPSAVNLIIMICSAEYSIVGRYRNMFQVGWSFLNCLEATNSSVNIFVYYNMSSRYRKCFREMFRLSEKENSGMNMYSEKGTEDTRT